MTYTLKQVSRRAFLLVAAALWVGGLNTGCGGGGGGGDSEPRATLATTRAATIRAVQQSRQLPTLLGALGSGIASRSRAVHTLSDSVLRKWAGTAATPTRQASELVYDEDFGLYLRTTEGTTSYRVDFYKDPEATQSAGNIVASITGLTTGQIRFNVTDGNVPLNGTLSLTRTDDDSLRIAGTVRQTRTNETISPNLTVTATGTTTGSIAVQESEGTLNYRDVTALESGAFAADLEFRGASGDVVQNSDGGGRVRLGLSDTQRYEANYIADGSGNLLLIDGAENGQLQTISDFDAL